MGSSNSKPSKMVDAFVGKWVVESKENYDGFMKGVGVPDEYINMSRDVKVVTDISKDGDAVVIARIRPQKTVTNKLVMGQESELDTIKGDKVKITATGDKYSFTMEMKGGKLHETITVKGHTMS